MVLPQVVVQVFAGRLAGRVKSMEVVYDVVV
jgi:hypothetical protein